MKAVSEKLQRALWYVPLLACGLQVFLGLVFLGELTGLLWHSRTFGWWVPLDPSLFGRVANWLLWGVSLLASIFPSIVAVARKRANLDFVVLLTFFMLPTLSLVVFIWSYYVGGTLLVGSGFVVAYALVSRSDRLLNIERGSALRVICTEVFALLAISAAGAVASVLNWQDDIFSALILGYDLTDPFVGMSRIDMEVFYLARPFLMTILAAMGAAGVLAMFCEPLTSLARLISKRTSRERRFSNRTEEYSRSLASRTSVIGTCIPYVILAFSVGLGVAVTMYPYAVAQVDRTLGSDMWFYQERLHAMKTASSPLSMLEADRGFFVLTLFALMRITNMDVTWVVRVAPALCSAFLAVSAFLLVREGTGRRWLAAFSALLSVVSAQTSLGMGAGILANWFALSLVNFMFAALLRSVRLHSKTAGVGSVLLSLAVLWSYAYMWVAAFAMLITVIIATLLSYSTRTREEWKHELKFLVATVVGVIAVPMVLVATVVPMLGINVSGFNFGAYASIAWNYLARTASPQTLLQAPTALEVAFDFAGNRIDLPFLTILSVIGLADPTAWRAPFRRILAAMVLVPLAITVVSPDLYLTWRGLYLIPLYLTGALGAASIIRRVNGHESTLRTSPSRLAFAGAFVSYLFLTHLSYSLRALELLILVASRW